MNKPNLAGKLARILGDIGAIKPEGRNQFHGYDYITEGQLSSALKVRLSQAGIFLLTSVDDVTMQRVTNQKGNEENLVTVRTTHTFMDSDTGEAYQVKGVGMGIDPGDKAIYKALTGGLKYVLMKNFLVSDHTDPEADEGVDERSTGKRKHNPFKEEPTPNKQTPAAKADAQMLEEWLKNEGITPEFVIELAREGKLAKDETSIGQLKAGTLTRLLSLRERISERWLLKQANLKPASDLPEKAPETPEQASVQPPARKRYSGNPRNRGRQFILADEAHPVDFLEEHGVKHWSDVRIHFGKLGPSDENKSGTALARLDKDDVLWWADNWQPKKYKGKWEERDLMLDAALCAAVAEFQSDREGGRVYGKAE
jgi:hypothetical protein